MDVLSEILLILSVLGSLTTLITFGVKMRKETKSKEREIAGDAEEEGAERVRVEMKMDYIKLQNETILAGNRSIEEKLDRQNERLTRLETTVKDARIEELPQRLAAVEESLKSAHRRIGELKERKGE